MYWIRVNLHPPSILAGKWPDHHQTCTWWTPGQRASRVCSRSRSRSKVMWYGHFCAVTKIASSPTQMTGSRRQVCNLTFLPFQSRSPGRWKHHCGRSLLSTISLLMGGMGRRRHGVTPSWPMEANSGIREPRRCSIEGTRGGWQTDRQRDTHRRPLIIIIIIIIIEFVESRDDRRYRGADIMMIIINAVNVAGVMLVVPTCSTWVTPTTGH